MSRIYLTESDLVEVIQSDAFKLGKSIKLISKPSENDSRATNGRFLNLPQSALFSEDLFFPNEKGDPHPNSYLITPFWKLFYWAFLVPDVIQFDNKCGKFILKKGSSLMQFISYLWLLLMTIYMSLIFLNDVEEKHTIKVIMSKVTWACYALFDITAIWCLRFNGHKIGKLLSEGNNISNLCESLRGMKERKKSTRIKSLVYSACLFDLIFTAAFVLVVILQLTAATTNLYNIFVDITNDKHKLHMGGGKANNTNHLCLHSDVLCTLFERYTSNAFASVLLTLWILMAYSVELIWVVFLTMTASWGYYFKRLFEQCIEVIEDYLIDVNKGIHIHVSISLLLEQFNKIFGYTLLWIIIANVLYIAASVGEILAGFNNGLLFDAINAIGFLPFIVTLYSGSELNRTGNVLPSVIKRQFMGWRYKETGQTLQILHGTSVVQYDALANNIGLQGAGFFVLRYQFVASLVGVIITYSLVTVQFKLGEIAIP